MPPEDQALLDQYVVALTPAPTWRVFGVLMVVPEIGGSALRLAAGLGGRPLDYQRFMRTMTFLRERGAVACRRPREPGEAGEARFARSPWVYSMSPLGRALVEVRERMVLRTMREASHD